MDVTHFIEGPAEKSPVLVVVIRGDLDFHTTPECERALNETLRGISPGEPLRLILDLSQCTFIDSIGLIFLAILSCRISVGNGICVLARPTVRVQRIINVTRLTEFLLISETREEARQMVAVNQETRQHCRSRPFVLRTASP
jgi:anti-anti-sigma factor